jgi:hypothetical protein
MGNPGIPTKGENGNRGKPRKARAYCLSLEQSMSNGTRCQLCGEIFYPDQTWKTLCLPCYKKIKRLEGEIDSELAQLRSENSRLRSMLANHSSGAIPPDMLNQLIRLAHPDRHGNSQAANDATAWLLSQRRIS